MPPGPPAQLAFSTSLALAIWWTTALAAGMLLAARGATRHTTLGPTRLWLAVAVALVGAVEGWAWWAPASASTGMLAPRWCAAAATCCPLMSALGAKRPQHLAWQWVVVSLMVVLCLPALRHGIAPGRTVTPHLAQQWFFAALVGLGAAHFLGTRYWLAGACHAAGQTLLLAPWLPGGWLGPADAPRAAGVLLLALAVMVGVVAWRRPRSAPPPWDRLWLDFRDTFGLFWALRVAERVNIALAGQSGDVVLAWSGFRQRAGDSHAASQPVEPPAAVQPVFLSLLERFVSPPWIAERLAQSVK